jgi:flagellar assembly protein FliH
MAGFQPLWQSEKARFTEMDLGAEDGFEPMGQWPRLAVIPETDVAEATDDERVPTPEPQPAPRTSEPGAQVEPASELDEASDIALLQLREDAFEVGRREGLEAAEAEVAAQVGRVQDLVQQLDGLRAELLTRSVEDLAATVMHVSRKIVGRELAVDSAGVEELVRSILKDVRGDDEIVVRVAEDDARLMRESYPELMELVGRDAELHMEIDSRLEPGGAIVETRHGTIDASIEARFGAFEEAVGGWVRHEVEAIDD